MSFYKERAETLAQSTETGQLTFAKADHSTGEGERYEERCAALAFLRCQRAGLRFNLSSNDAAAGKFDDIVLCWRDEQSPNVAALLVQLKNKTSGKHTTVNTSALMGSKEAKSKDFAIKMYYESYKKFIKDLDDGSYTLVLYTNIDVDQDAQHLFVRQEPESVPGLKLVATGGCCYKLNPDNEAVNRAVQSDQQFMDHFFLLCGQSNSKTIMSDVHKELRLLLGANDETCVTMCKDLCDRIRDWMNTENMCLTNNWSTWLAMVDAFIKAEVTSLKSILTRIKYSQVGTLEAHIRGCNPAWVRPPGREAAALTATRVQQAVCGEGHIVINMTQFAERQDKIMCCWGPFRRWLVLVDDAEHSYDTLRLMGHLTGPKRRLVIVSYKGEDSFQDTCKAADIDDDCWKSLIDVTVNLNSEQQSCCLKDLCDIESLKAVLDRKPEALVALSQLSSPVRMGQDLSPLPRNYISRELTSRMRIREEFFSSLGEKEVCITDEESYKILISQTVLKSTIRFEELEKCLSASDAGWPRFFVTDNIDLSAVESICRKYPNIIKYVLSYADEGWEIQFFHRGSEKIRLYAEKQSKSLLRIVDGVSNRIIIEGKPGMGKSTMLLDVASQLNGQITSYWILRIDLSNFSEAFDKCDSGVNASEDILDQAVNNKGNLGILERTLLQHCLLQHPHIICLVDGFDEVCPDYTDICLQALQALAPRRGKLLVTTRPSVVGHLEEALGVLAHSLPPFSEDELHRYHGWHGSEIGITEVVRDLLKIPLFSRMYADLKKDDIKVADIVDLYEAFFERKFKILCVEKYGENLSKAGKKKDIEWRRREHEKQLGFLVASHLFPRLELEQLSSIDQDDVVKSGVIDQFINGKPVFIHRTFAEYFLAKWCFSNTAGGMCASVYRKAISDSSLEFFVESFNRMASRGRPLLMAVLKGSESEVESLLEKGADPAERDVVGRNSLHLAAGHSRDATLLRLLRDHLQAVGARGSAEMRREAGVDYRVGEVARTEGPERRVGVSELVEASGSAGALGADLLQAVEALDAALGVEDSLLHWTPLRYAAERQHWWAVTALLEMGAQLDHLGDFRRDVYDPEKMWNIFEKHGYIALSEHIRRMNTSLWSPEFEDNRNEQIQVGVTIVCAELPVSKYEAIYKEAYRNNHFEVVKLIDRKTADEIKKLTCGSPALERCEVDDHNRLLPHQAELSNSTDQQVTADDDGAAYHDAGVNTMLHYAAATGDAERLRQAIATGDDVNAQDGDGASALHFAAHVGNVSCIKWLLRAGADINIRDNIGETPLMIAAAKGRVQCVKLLLDAGADANVQDSRGFTALHLAARWNAECLQLLIHAVENLESPDEVGRTALFIAAGSGNDESVKHLLRAGARVGPMTDDLETPLHAAAVSGNAECVRQLVQAKADVRAKNKGGLNALHCAAFTDNTECVEKLLESGASVTEWNKDGRTPLHFAADSGSAGSTRRLLEKGAGVGDRDKDGNTALHCAAAAGSVEVVRLLIRAGADVDERNKQGLAPLHGAAHCGHGRSDGPGSDAQQLSLAVKSKLRDYSGCARELLKSGADVDARTTSGETALHFAVMYGSAECVGVLLEAKADLGVQDSNRLRPIDYAMKRKNHSVIRLLVNADARTILHYAAKTGNAELLQQVIASGTDVNARDREGESALHYAAYIGNVGCIKLLLHAGADINIENTKGRTPLSQAAEKGWLQCVKLLLDNGADANIQDSVRDTPLLLAVRGWNSECVRLLIRAVENLESTDQDGRTALFLAAGCGNAESVKHLLRAGARVSSMTDSLYTPLHAAAFRGNAECVRQLVQAKADVTAKGKDGLNPLHCAVIRGNTECVVQLLEAGASVMDRDNEDQTPLHFAADTGSTGSTRCLLEKGARVDDCDKNDSTALHHAAAAGSVEVVRLLIRAGADVNARNNQGLTPLHGAAYSGRGRSDGPGSDALPLSMAVKSKLRDYSGCARELLKASADVDATTTSGDTALHFAVMYGSAECVGVLLEAKPDLGVQDSHRSTPLHYAMRRKNHSIIRLLLDAGADMFLYDENRLTPLHYLVLQGKK